MLREANSLSASPELSSGSLPANDSRGIFRELFPWAAKGGLAILDQGLFAGTNFIVNILLARWLTPAEYGAFALALSVFLLFGTFYTASLTEPMMVFGPGKYASHFREYLGILLRGHFIFVFPATVMLVGAGFLLGRVYSASVERAFLGLALAAPFILLLSLARQAFYVQLRPGWAAGGGFLYLTFLLSLICALQASQRLSLVTAFIGMGVGALVVSLFLLFVLGPSWTAERGNPSAKMVFADHWRYGRWSVATAGIIWLPSNVYYVVLPIWLGLEGSGGLKALMNLAMPALQSINALSLLLLPLLVQSRKESGTHAMANTMRSFLALFLFGSALYLALLWGLRSEIFRLLYAGKYTEYASWPLLLTGVLPLVACVTAVLSNALRALERPDRVFWCYLGSSIVALLGGIALVAIMGVTGALLGQLFSSLTAGTLMFWFYQRFLRDKAKLGV
jgi:O-antigen/teichoic acid export membrane protein